jgi:MinD-like ATPase involved in chromosome partitioning or flagellar assembly
MKTVTFYSYKGGTGRSLAVANAARYLARLNFKVVALDFDLEAPGLHYKFSTDKEGKPIAVQTGIVDYLHEFITEGAIPASLEKFVITLAVPGTDQPLLRLIAAGQGPSPDYWKKLSQINWHELFYTPDAKGVQLFLDLKQRIANELQPDFLLIDSRTGITEMGGVAATLLADRVVCLVIPTLENMEGARAVLRSLKHTRREMVGEDIELVLALSRLPDMKNAEEELKITGNIQSFFNEEAENLENTLSCPHIFTLHAEAALELREVLRVGGNISPDESILLRDYLRLFATLVPKELMLSQVDVLVEQAKARMWDDPEGALLEMEELTESFGHPDIYRALFQFYRVRNVQGISALKKAQRYWQISRDNHNPWVWTVIQNSFKPPSRWEKEWSPDLDFIAAVWRNAGANDESVARRLADAYTYQDQNSKTADIFLELLTSSAEPTAKIVIDYMEALRRAQRNSEARDIINSYKPAFSENFEFILAWADFALATMDEDFLNELATPEFIGLLEKNNSILPIALLDAVGRDKDAYAWAENHLLNTDYSNSNIHELMSLVDKLKSRGSWDLVEKHIRPRLTAERWGELESRIKRGYGRRM